MITFVCVEWGDHRSHAWSIIVGKLHKGKESEPVVLLIVTVDPNVLFQGLISALSLPITFWMVSQGEVQLHVQGCAKRLEEV